MWKSATLMLQAGGSNTTYSRLGLGLGFSLGMRLVRTWEGIERSWTVAAKLLHFFRL